MKLLQVNKNGVYALLFVPKGDNPTVSFLNRCWDKEPYYNDYFFNVNEALKYFG
jgi:hypothetical protein